MERATHEINALFVRDVNLARELRGVGLVVRGRLEVWVHHVRLMNEPVTLVQKLLFCTILVS